MLCMYIQKEYRLYKNHVICKRSGSECIISVHCYDVHLPFLFGALEGFKLIHLCPEWKNVYH